ncbi:MAG: type II secretion system F family protein [Actinomycetota bacterium]
MRLRRLASVLVLGVLLSLLAPWAAQAADSKAGIRKVDTSKFPQVAVTISLPGTASLATGDIQLAENSKPIGIDGVQPLGAPSIQVVLAIDLSTSMRGEALTSAIGAAKRFLDGLPAEARVGLVTFSAQADTLVPLTTDHAKVAAALGHLPATHFGTALFDAVRRASGMFSGGGQHNIVLLANGPNNTGTTDREGTISMANADDATIFSVGFRGGDTDVQTMVHLAQDTSGTYQSAQTGKLSSLYAALASRLSDQYVVTYTSQAQPGDQIDVQMVAAGNPLTALVLAPKPHVKGPIQPEVHQVRPLLHGTIGLLVAIVVTFCALFILAIMAIGTGARLKRERATADRMRAVARPQAATSNENRSAAWIPAPMVEMADRVVDAGGFGAALEHKLEQGGVPFRAGEFLAASVIAGLGGMVVGFLLFTNIFLALAFGVVGGAGPWLFVLYKLNQRTQKLNLQLPDVLNVLASSLRSGHSFLQALDTASKDIPEPAAGEFSRTVAEIRLGRPLDEAMNAMAERVGSENFRWAVLAVNIQRQVGGNLAEILDTVANTVRERATLIREVRVLTTEGRLSMYILTALPILFALYLFLSRPEYVSLLYTTRVGIVMSATAAALLLVGFVWFKKIVRIDV